MSDDRKRLLKNNRSKKNTDCDCHNKARAEAPKTASVSAKKQDIKYWYCRRPNPDKEAGGCPLKQFSQKCTDNCPGQDKEAGFMVSVAAKDNSKYLDLYNGYRQSFDLKIENKKLKQIIEDGYNGEIGRLMELLRGNKSRASEGSEGSESSGDQSGAVSGDQSGAESGEASGAKAGAGSEGSESSGDQSGAGSEGSESSGDQSGAVSGDQSGAESGEASGAESGEASDKNIIRNLKDVLNEINDLINQEEIKRQYFNNNFDDYKNNYKLILQEKYQKSLADKDNLVLQIDDYESFTNKFMNYAKNLKNKFDEDAETGDFEPLDFSNDKDIFEGKDLADSIDKKFLVIQFDLERIKKRIKKEQDEEIDIEEIDSEEIDFLIKKTLQLEGAFKIMNSINKKIINWIDEHKCSVSIEGGAFGPNDVGKLVLKGCASGDFLLLGSNDDLEVSAKDFSKFVVKIKADDYTGSSKLSGKSQTKINVDELSKGTKLDTISKESSTISTNLKNAQDTSGTIKAGNSASVNLNAEGVKGANIKVEGENSSTLDISISSEKKKIRLIKLSD